MGFALLGMTMLALAAPVPLAPDFASRFVADSARAIQMVDRGSLDSAHAVVAPLVGAARRSGDRAWVARAMVLRAATDMRIGHAAPVMDTILTAEKLAAAARDTATWMSGLRVESMGRNYLGRSDVAEKLAHRWFDLATASHNAEYQAWAHTMFGWLASRRGDLPTARRELETALPTFEAMHHRAGEPYTLNVLANVLVAQGEYERGRTMLHRLLDLGHAYDNPQIESYALQNLGAVEGRIGDPAQAIGWYRQAMEIAQKRGDVQGQLVDMSNMGELALRIGRVTDAEKIAREAIALSQKNAMGLETPWHQEELADALWAGSRSPEAKALWRSVIARGDSVALDPRAVATLGLARALAREDSSTAGLAAIDAVLARYEKGGDADLRARLLIERAEILLAQGRDAEALAVASRHASADEARGNLELALAAWTQVAEAARRLGKHDVAAHAVAAATVDWERGRSRITELEYRELRGEQARRLAIECVEAALATPDSAGRPPARAAF